MTCLDNGTRWSEGSKKGEGSWGKEVQDELKGGELRGKS